MSEASFASLNPALLARKGGAKPAMRPQLHSLPDSAETEGLDPAKLEDLGWNDMGVDAEGTETASAEVYQLKPAAANEDFGLIVDKNAEHDGEEAEEDQPVVLRQRKKIAKKMALAEKPRKAKKASPKKSAKGTAKDGERRAAFTLRLDTDRHLKLRLAATMQGKSAQAVVTEALDAMLEQIDDIDALAQRMKRT